MNIEKIKHKLFNNFLINKTLSSVGYKLQKIGIDYTDIPEEYKRIYLKIKPYTMCSEINVYTLLRLQTYVINNSIEGCIVECGVWRGGMVMAMLENWHNLFELKYRNFYLFDTFNGMPKPTEDDGELANKLFNEIGEDWCKATLEDVQINLDRCLYPKLKLNLVKGKVEDRLPNYDLKGEPIALLRLDTDWYESTKCELEMLYDKVSSRGVVIIDDYNAWGGSRKAVDEFFSKRGGLPFLHRIDNGAVYFIKK